MSKSMEKILSEAIGRDEQLPRENNKSKPLEITDRNVEQVDWSKKKKKKSRSYHDKEVCDWGVRDLLFYAKNRFYNKFSYHLPVALATGFEEIKKLQEELSKQIGQWPSPQYTKNYIDWFMEIKCSELINKYTLFKIRMIRHPLSVREFVDRYDLKPTQETEPTKQDQSIENQREILPEPKDDFSFVLNYGLVLSLKYFLDKGNSFDEAIRIVADHIKRISSEGNFSSFVNATEYYNPYPMTKKIDGFENAKRRISEISGKRMNIISIVFSEEAKEIEFCGNNYE